MSEAAAKSQDLTGQANLKRNVAFAWGGYVVNVIVGFVMPRLINDRLGQTTLGLWDFVWSIVSYFGLVQMGISTSVQRYVAKYRAVGDGPALNRSVSTIAYFLNGAGLFTLLLVACTAIWIVPAFGHKIGGAIREVQLAVVFLGIEMALSMMLATYGGVIVGCHRWDIHNTISAITYGLSGLGMIVVLHTGGGLPALALVHAIAFTGSEVARWRLARRVCPDLKVEYALASRQVLAEQFRFSAKGIIPRIGGLISNQALSILITLYLGPASLAIFSRPRALITTIAVLIAKAGSVLIPTVSSLQAQSDNQALERTFRTAIKYTSFLVLPPVAVMALFGDYVIRLWMGEAYAYWALIAIVTIGSVATLANEPVWCILVGLNVHGRLALIKLGAAICSAVALGIGLAFFHWGLIGAAICWSLPQIAVDGYITPATACRRFNIPVSEYFRAALWSPLLRLAPFIGLLALARLSLSYNLQLAIACVFASAVALVAVLYIYVVPESLKAKGFLSRFRTSRPVPPVPAETPRA